MPKSNREFTHKTPRVSVLMPAYNCEGDIQEAIDSIIDQTYRDWELVIVDDGSTDNTRAIIAQYTDPRIRSAHNPENLGVAKTRNKLLSLARGEYIVWQDADDISLPNRLHRLLTAFEQDTQLVVCGSSKVLYLPHTGEKRVRHYPATHAEIRAAIQAGKFPFLGPTTAVKRSAIHDDLRFREFFAHNGEDPDWLLRLTERCKSANLQEELYIYRYNRQSLSKQIKSNDVIRLNAMKIVFFLAQQRHSDGGLDGLMDGGDKDALTQYISIIRQDDEQDKSIVCREACKAKISNHDYVFALRDALSAVRTSPMVSANYRLFFVLMRSMMKLTLTRIHQRVRSQNNGSR